MTLPCSELEQMRELVHVGFDQLLIFEHDPRAALRIGRRPGGLRGLRGIDRFLEVGGRAQADMGLHLALIGVEHLALPLAAGKAGTADEMVDAAKHGYASCSVVGVGAPLDPHSRNASCELGLRLVSLNRGDRLLNGC